MKDSDNSNLSYDTRLFIGDCVYNLWEEMQDGQIIDEDTVRQRVMTDWLYFMGKQIKEDGEEMMKMGEDGEQLKGMGQSALTGAFDKYHNDMKWYDTIGDEAVEEWRTMLEEDKENEEAEQEKTEKRIAD